MVHPFKTDARNETYSYNMYVTNGTEAHTVGGFNHIGDAKADAIKEGVDHLISGIDGANINRFVKNINDESIMVHIQRIVPVDNEFEDSTETFDVDTFTISLNINSIH